MSDATPMPCLDPPCMAPLACNQAGSCRHRRIDSLGSWALAISEAKARGIRDPFRKEDRG